MSDFALMAGFFLALKLCGVLALAAYLRRCIGTWHLAIPVAWVGLQLILFAVMFVSSAFGGLNGVSIWLAIGLVALLTLKQRQSLELPVSPSRGECALCMGGLLLTCVLWFRSLYYFDTTWDALVYGLPRIAFYVQSGSVFYHQSTPALNLFCNEWNAELISLASRLATGRDQATSLAGVEIWTWTALGLFALSRQLGASRLISAGTSLLLISTPAVLGLATVVKGDLMAVGALALASACLAQTARTSVAWSAGAAVVVLAFGAGGKVVLLPALPVVFLGAAFLYRQWWSWSWVGATGLIASIGLARYWANLWIYATPLKRINNESSAWSAVTLWENVKGIGAAAFNQTFGGWISGERWVLAFGLGAVGWLALVVGLVLLGLRLRQQSVPATRPVRTLPVWLWVALGSSALPGLFAIPWMPWSLRYHLPWLALVLTFALVQWPALTQKARSLYVLAVLAVAGIQASHVVHRGEAFPRSVQEQVQGSDVERKMALHSYFLTPALAELAVQRQSVFDTDDSLISTHVSRREEGV